MFGFLNKINDSVKETIKNTIISTTTILVVSFFMNMILINQFADTFKQTATRAYQSYTDTSPNKEFFIVNDNIYIVDIPKDQVLQLKNRKFLDVDASNLSTPFFTIEIQDNVYIDYPFYVNYDFDTINVKLELTGPNYFAILLFLVLGAATIFINILYSISLSKNMSRMQHLKVSVQEYALSQRTTSYLVSIIHHKLNTPLKVLSTKSRVMIKTIEDSENIDKKTIDKSKTDYIQMDRALKTILNVTGKLKSYNELSQNELNIYKLFTIAKETIDILKDDEFQIDVDYKAKLYDIDKTVISSHEIIQIFINQIKFSLAQLADKIGIRIFKYDEESITILYSDNGNMIDDDLNDLISKQSNVSDISDLKLESDHYDLILNFNILNENDYSYIKILSSNKNGNVFQIKLPTFKQDIDKGPDIDK